MIEKFDLSKGTKATYIVTCSRKPNQGTEYMCRIINGQPYTGAKRKASINKNGKNTNTAFKKLATKVQIMVNGLNRDCLFCDNSMLLICGCGQTSCGTHGRPHTCPNCNRHMNELYIEKLVPILARATPTNKTMIKSTSSVRGYIEKSK